MEKPGNSGLMLEHENELWEILEAVQILHREVIKEPALKGLQINLIEKIVRDKLLCYGTIPRMGIVLGRQQALHQRVDGRLVALGLVAFDEDDVIFLGVEFLRILAIEAPVLAIATDEIVLPGFEFEATDCVEGRGDCKQNARNHGGQRPTADEIGQSAEIPLSHDENEPTNLTGQCSAGTVSRSAFLPPLFASAAFTRFAPRSHMGPGSL